MGLIFPDIQDNQIPVWIGRGLQIIYESKELTIRKGVRYKSLSKSE